MESDEKTAVDKLLDSIDDDAKIQDVLDAVSRELRNLNIPVWWMPEKYAGDSEFRQLLQLLSVHVEPNVEALSYHARSDSQDRFWLGDVLRQSVETHGELTSERITEDLARCLLGSRQYGIDEYVENLENFDILEDLDILQDREGLIDITSSRFKLLTQGLSVDGEHLIYLHQYLRRYFSGNFTDLPRILNRAIAKRRKVEVRIDPLRKTIPENHRWIIEEDYWSGPKFNDSLLASTDKKETRTVHVTRQDGMAAKLLGLSYPVYQTDFRSSILDDGFRQISIEEYVPMDNPYGRKAPGLGKKYHIQKFAHVVYDQATKVFEHVDCAVRVFPLEDYIQLFNSVKAGKDPGSHNGDRYKLVKISGELEQDEVEALVFEFFRYNIHISEFFGDMSEDEALAYLRNRS